MTVVFDLGPQAPVRPVKPAVLLETPELPPGATGPDEYSAALERYTQKYCDYLVQLDGYEKERADWERQSGGGAVEISTTQGNIIECGHGGYVAVLPPDVKLGPKSGTNRVIHS
jgi:hypothetical protein